MTGGLSNGSCPITGTPFLVGTEPKKACGTIHQRRVVVEGEEPEERGYEGLWKRKAREAAEAAPASDPSAPPAPPTPVPPPG